MVLVLMQCPQGAGHGRGVWLGARASPYTAEDMLCAELVMLAGIRAMLLVLGLVLLVMHCAGSVAVDVCAVVVVMLLLAFVPLLLYDI